MNSLTSVLKGILWSSARRVAIVLGATISMLLFSLPLFSQTSTGRILGAITDQSGGTVAGATVTITDVQRGTSRTLTTDESGLYAAPNLLPGTYSVRARGQNMCQEA